MQMAASEKYMRFAERNFAIEQEENGEDDEALQLPGKITNRRSKIPLHLLDLEYDYN